MTDIKSLIPAHTHESLPEEQRTLFNALFRLGKTFALTNPDEPKQLYFLKPNGSYTGYQLMCSLEDVDFSDEDGSQTLFFPSAKCFDQSLLSMRYSIGVKGEILGNEMLQLKNQTSPHGHDTGWLLMQNPFPATGITHMDDDEIGRVFTPRFIERMLTGIVTLHTHGYAHNDLNIGNLFINQNDPENPRLLLIDWDMSTQTVPTNANDVEELGTKDIQVFNDMLAYYMREDIVPRIDMDEMEKRVRTKVYKRFGIDGSDDAQPTHAHPPIDELASSLKL